MTALRHVHLATGLSVRSDGAVLLVASRYPNVPQALWNLPGGRQEPGELLVQTVAREVFEETGLRVRVGELAYVSESYDRNDDVHFVNATFCIAIEQADAAHEPRVPGEGAGDHVVEVAWIPASQLAAHIRVEVVREPLLAYLRGDLQRRYAGFSEAGITIRWPSEPT